MQKISYVIPCYRSQHTVGGVVAEIAATMQTLPQYDYEVILVNDCSPDDTSARSAALWRRTAMSWASIWRKTSASMRR